MSNFFQLIVQWLSLSFFSLPQSSFSQFETDSTQETTIHNWWWWIKILQMITSVGSMKMFPWETQIKKEKNHTTATNVSIHPLWKADWEVILKCTTEKSHTNATNATMLLLMQAIWGHIWKLTVEKSQTNATNVTLHPLIQVVWGHIWKCTVEKSQTNALCSYPHVNVSIRDFSQILTTAPIFLYSIYFRQKYLEIASCAVSLLNNIWVRVEHSLLQQLNFRKSQLQFKQSAGRMWIKLWGQVEH